ncbi:MAG: energy transducer TonB [Pseudomonadota bacterium]
MKKLTILAAAFFASLASAAAPCWAAEPYLEAYARYTAAIDAGDYETAAREAEQAYDLASKAEGVSDETRAILGQNFITLIIWDEPERALRVAEETFALAERGFGVENYSRAEVGLMLRYAEFAKRPRGKQAKALIAALEPLREGSNVNEFVITAHVQSALALFAKKFDDDAYIVLTALGRMLEAVEGVQPKLLATANLIRVSSMIARERQTNVGGVRRAYADALRDARVIVDHTIASLPRPETIDTYDDVLGAAWAWRNVIFAMASSLDIKMSDEDWSFEGKAPLTDLSQEVTAFPGRENCPVTWVKQASLTYPSAAVRDFSVGGAILGYHIGPDGRVEEVRILGEVPAPLFGEAARKTIGTWVADPNSLDDPACFRNNVIRVIFSF